MNASLSQLIQLQAVDSQLMEIEEQKGDLPAQVEQLSDELIQLADGVTSKGARREEIDHDERRLQGAIDDNREHLKKYQEQLLLVATNRAYDALTAEIDGVKKSLDDDEFRLLELGEERQRLTDELKSDDLLSKQKRGELAVQKESLEATIAANEKRARELARQRKATLALIEPKFLEDYERIRAARDGRAVVPISRGACGVCFHRIPTQQQVEIKSGNQILTCDSCGVILHWVDD